MQTVIGQRSLSATVCFARLYSVRAPAINLIFRTVIVTMRRRCVVYFCRRLKYSDTVYLVNAAAFERAVCGLSVSIAARGARLDHIAISDAQVA